MQASPLVTQPTRSHTPTRRHSQLRTWPRAARVRAQRAEHTRLVVLFCSLLPVGNAGLRTPPALLGARRGAERAAAMRQGGRARPQEEAARRPHERVLRDQTNFMQQAGTYSSLRVRDARPVRG